MTRSTHSAETDNDPETMAIIGCGTHEIIPGHSPIVRLMSEIHRQARQRHPAWPIKGPFQRPINDQQLAENSAQEISCLRAHGQERKIARRPKYGVSHAAQSHQ